MTIENANKLKFEIATYCNKFLLVIIRGTALTELSDILFPWYSISADRVGWECRLLDINSNEQYKGQNWKFILSSSTSGDRVCNFHQDFKILDMKGDIPKNSKINNFFFSFLANLSNGQRHNLTNSSCLQATKCFKAQAITTETEDGLNSWTLNISQQKDRYIGLEPLDIVHSINKRSPLGQ